jgi:undecaprenyl-diphosphatase
MRSLKDFDRNYSTEIRSLPADWRRSMITISMAGEPAVIACLGIFGFLLSISRHKPASWHAFLYAGIAYGVNICLKLILHRKRPHGRVIRTLGVQSYSFPSGHAFGSVLLYGLLTFLAIRHLASAVAVLTAGLLLLLIFSIGISRVYLGTHYPSDVAAGWLLGAISLAIVIVLAFA